MEALINLIAAHSTIVTVAAIYVFMAFVGGMPEPGDPRPLPQKVYSMFYTALHLLMNKVEERRPGMILPPMPPSPLPDADPPAPKQTKI